MPRVKLIREKPKPVNHLAAVLRGYKLSSGLTADQIGERLGVTGDRVRHQIGRPADQWTIGDLKRFCDIIHCPHDEALAAAARK